MKRYIDYWLMVIVALSLPSCKQSSGKEEQSDNLEQYPVSALHLQSIKVYQEYPATLKGEQNIEIRPKVDGFVEKIYVDEGEQVKRGQALFKIHAPQYEQEVRTASAAIASTAAEVNTARMQYNKTKPLVDEDIISKYELEQAANLLATKEAALQQAKANLINAKTNVGYTIINSPVSGVVGNLPYKIGSLVSNTSPQPLTTVSNIGKIHAYFSFNERQFLDFMGSPEGENLEKKLEKLPKVRLILANGSEYPQSGKIETIGGLINTETGSINLRATFPNPAFLIKSGASAVLKIPAEIKDALVIPAKAAQDIQGKLFVYTVDSQGVVKSREIQIMELPLKDQYVVKRGLQAADQLVLEGIMGLQDGEKIKPLLKK
ncbi:efflux RND transporter periplasmic adaptor subunit [Olivibacter domesticus]|uniref:Membrane fusion protein, multidrug efflux system n=1 Tax=Olivibacter domesticus TaxID=407022 RepID=A0A1H7LZG1_OLID1|nr:efflux RND transporter periplasmic adaptor subunit [Olivibacter domesticus]SEL04353.1 membrane fusion protein, multidrug efflux system [Olivibacter domesticus]